MCEIYQCRICLDENDTPKSYISPCLCRGTNKYVHRSCLETWRMQDPNGINSTKCPTCHYDYIIDDVITDPVTEINRMKKYILSMTCLIIKMITMFVIVVCLVTVMVYLIDMRYKCFTNRGYSSYMSYIVIAILYILITPCIVCMLIYTCINIYHFNSNPLIYIPFMLLMGFMFPCIVIFIYLYEYFTEERKNIIKTIWKDGHVHKIIRDFGLNGP